MKQTAVEWLRDLYENQPAYDESILDEQWQKALEMEKANHEKFNKFLNGEKQLGISDLKTIERIQWYYNTYFNGTFNTNEK